MDIRENLIDEMIRIYGFENPITIEFAEMCENPKWDIKTLKTILESHKLYPQF